jgi:sugar lactone lactonase YvrE
MSYRQFSLDQVTSAATGFHGPEGVVVDRDGNVYGGGLDGVIRKLSPDGRVSEFARTGGRPAGMAMDRDGNLFVCVPHQTRAGVYKVAPNGNVELFADRVDDVALTIPNFPVFDAEGNLYVSNSMDIVFDLERVLAELSKPPAPRGALVRLRPDGSGDVVAKGLYFANGTAIDPGEEAVYVLQSTQNNCVRIPKKNGVHGQPEQFGEDLGALPAFTIPGWRVVRLNDGSSAAQAAAKLVALAEPN